jgi:spermidine/putrescine transport system permease protein
MNNKMTIPNLSKPLFTLFFLCSYLFLYLPISILVLFSFNEAPFPDAWKGFSLRWYEELLHSPHVLDAFKTSLIVAISATAITLILSLSLIYAHTRRPLLSSILPIFYTNLLIPEILFAVGFLTFLSFLKIELGLVPLIITHTVLGLGYMVPILYAQYSQIDKRLIEASLDLGATPFRTFFSITIPLLFSPLLAGSLLIFIVSFDDFILAFFCSGPESQTLSLYIFSSIRAGVSPAINALATLLLLMSSLLVMLLCSLKARSKIF